MIRLFEISNNTVIPTEHCHTIKWLKAILDGYPDNYLNVLTYIFYMTCPNQENPYFNLPEAIREDNIAEDIDINFDTEDDLIQIALKKAEKLYETPSVRAYKGISKMLDNLSDYMGATQIVHGRDGNISALVQAAKNFQAIRESFKGVAKDLEAEQQSHVRGSQNLGYDQM
jgi:hypothetical protein